MDKLYYSIGEVAKMLDENSSAVRFWADSFPAEVKPQRNKKGNRLFSAKDIDALKQIKHLLRDCGLTIEGAERKLKSERNSLKKKVEALEGLRQIRRDLDAVRKSL